MMKEKESEIQERVHALFPFLKKKQQVQITTAIYSSIFSKIAQIEHEQLRGQTFLGFLDQAAGEGTRPHFSVKQQIYPLLAVSLYDPELAMHILASIAEYDMDVFGQFIVDDFDVGQQNVLDVSELGTDSEFPAPTFALFFEWIRSSRIQVPAELKSDFTRCVGLKMLDAALFQLHFVDKSS